MVRSCPKCNCPIFDGEEMCPDCLTPIKQKKNSEKTIKIKKLYDYAKIQKIYTEFIDIFSILNV